MRRCAFTIADKKNMEYYNKFKKSWDKFCPDVELLLYDDKKIKTYKQEHWFYKATPIIANELFAKGYDAVLKMDCDQIVTGNIDHIWEDEYDVAVVQNTNPRDQEFCKPYIAKGIHRLTIYHIPELLYVNCGLVVMKNKEFTKQWEKVTEEHFAPYQFGEQDLLNILIFYGTYNVRFLDMGNMWHGVISKWYWKMFDKVGDDLILKKNNEWPRDEDKIIKVIHYAGGKNLDHKMKDFELTYKPEVAEYLTKLTS